jgi:4-carboxymuconolactone decarboxylase
MTIPCSHRSLAIALMLAGMPVLTFAQSKAAADLDPVSKARLPYLNKTEVDAKGQEVVNIFANKTDGTVRGPLAFAVYNGGVGKALLDLHNAAVGGSLDAHTRELAIMVACRETNYNLEWNGHEAAALKAGIEAKVLDIVKLKKPVDGLSEKDAVVIRFGRQLYQNKKVDSATFARVVEFWGKKGAMDMVAVMNTYAVSGYFAIAVNEQAAEGKTALPEVK